MKVLLINGSPHANGCTFTALNEVARTLGENGIDTNIVHIGHKDIRGCTGCHTCGERGKCVFDDLVNELAPVFAECNGLVIGSPVYYSSPNGSLLAFLDRLFYSSPFDKTMKVGAAVVSARRTGCSSTFDVLNKYFTISGMPVVPSQYWNEVHGSKAEDVLKDEEGMQTMRVLGRNMAFLIKSIELGKERYGLPEKENKIYTNFIRG